MASDDDDNQDRAAMFEALRAHGQAFLQAFSVPTSAKRGTKRKREEARDFGDPRETLWMGEAEGEDEWHGFDDLDDETSATSEADSIDLKRDADRTSSRPVNRDPLVVDFAQTTSISGSSAGRLRDKAFMSSKVSKLRKPSPNLKPDDGRAAGSDDEGLNSSNAKNDAELHRLVHTKLLSASLNPALGLSPAQKRKAISGRIMELSGTVRLGEGEKRVRKEEHNQAPQHIRDGIQKKQHDRERKQLEEAKQLGNYHPTIKHHFAASSKSGRDRTRRQRGIGSGVGTFVGGTLKLSRKDLEGVRSVSGSRRPREGGQRRSTKR